MEGLGTVSIPFYILDVFARERFAGNQLAVFRNAGGLSGGEMQRIAKEMNFSETTFILSDEKRDGGYDVRIFTPAAELPFAGHPTLGTAYLINREIAGGRQKIVLNLKAGRIHVTFEEGGLTWMRQNEPVFGATLSPEEIAPVLGLAPDEIDERYPVEEVSTGLPFIIIPLKTLESIKRACTVPDLLFDMVRDLEAKQVLVFSPETEEEGARLKVRVFADYLGVKEDPATGSANGCLAGYLVRHRYLGAGEIDIAVEQGREVGRPSMLHLRAREAEGGRIQVDVGGNVILVARGELITRE